MTEPGVKITAFYSRKVKVADYETADCAATVEEVFAGHMDPAAVNQTFRSLMQHAKSTVFSELGLSFTQDPDTGIIHEVLGGVPVQVTQPMQPPIAPAPAAPPVAIAPPVPVVPPAAAPVAAAAPADDLWTELATQPGLWQDLRPLKASGTMSAKAPDFRSTHRTQPSNPKFKSGLWLSDMPAGFALPAAGFAPLN